jgi:oxygen-independent coproporphyrinogen-3 oxidase
MILNHSIYIHIPFCTHRCAYCDFNTYAGQEDMIPAYVDALCKEIDFIGSLPSRSVPESTQRERAGGDGEIMRRSDARINVHTVFLGGGTPSLLAPKQFESILKAIRANFSLAEDAELTMEANPGTVSYANLIELRKLGINRISFGVQSANMEELRMLERAHTFFDVIEAVSWARKAGFDNLNLDMIYGLPEQTLQTWQTTVKRILDLHPEHISAYALTLEHGTPFGRWSAKGLLPLPDPDLAADMYEWASETFEAQGHIQYEISNWSKPRHQCEHNLQYWRGLPYLAFGAGAHGYADGYRYSNVLRIKTYIDRLSSPSSFSPHPFPLSPATANHHKQSLQDDMSEFMITGLRLTQEGVSDNAFQTRFGTSMHDVYGKEIGELLKLGLVERYAATGADGRPSIVCITKRGRLLGNQVFMQFVD